MDKQNKAFLTSFVLTGLACIIFLIFFTGCKKKVQQVQYNDNPAPQEQKQKQEHAKDDGDSTVWQIQTHHGNFEGHKLEINSGTLEFISSDGYKVYASPPFLFKAKAE